MNKTMRQWLSCHVIMISLLLLSTIAIIIVVVIVIVIVFVIAIAVAIVIAIAIAIAIAIVILLIIIISIIIIIISSLSLSLLLLLSSLLSLLIFCVIHWWCNCYHYCFFVWYINDATIKTNQSNLGQITVCIGIILTISEIEKLI